ncbi:ABC transporter ATP-binding protein/permease [Glycomyces sp. TRM65418]|uniref:ABC transporter ATP-binding protein n=1 Tax=Glycomyces sp. TRM65418 TaxID=2867006 RepID=UPI001CE645DE|nr:ABC transporter ATP-binding protein [Glycomyces sp. TRM65418]MCC3761639.1 ABC transporter ATP-binding protein/permease [Glycomyces sp. TRM65418]QZD55733.1 ABC transporter ATP-binding protein/permease [Glycomyces sp. TRM65418]
MPAQSKADDFRGTVRRILGLLRRDRLRLASVLGFGVLMVCGMLSIPTVLGRATDLVIDGAAAGGGLDFAGLGRLLGLAVALALGTFVVTVANGRTIAKLAQTMAFALRAEADRKVSSLPLRYFDSRSRGEVLSRVTNDIDNLTQTVGVVTQRIVQGLLFLVGVPIMMLTISPLLTLVVLATMPLTVLAARQIGKRSQPRFAQQWATTGRLNGHVEEMITGHQLVTLFGRQAQGAAQFKRHNDELYEHTVRAQWVAGLLGPAMAFLGSVTYVLVAVVGGLQVAAAVLSFGQIQAFIQYTGQFSNPLNMLAGLFGQVQSAVASGERVFEFLDAEEQSPDPAAAGDALASVHGRVAFEDVSFRYLPDEPLIEHLWLSASPGETIAIVGPTGAGKTTLVNLLMRFYDLDAGRITVDGVDVATVERERLRRRIGMVLQDTWLFDGTIAENIAYGRPEASREEVVAAASAAHADHFIRTLPDGYDTVVGAEEGSLSAGERQLVTIARAFLIDPSILILDEATSSVDTRTEMLVQQGMVALRQGRTSFVIAHRLSTIRDADVIVVMEHGRVVEQGGHDDLLAAGGAYARLYEAQFAQPAADPETAGT